LHLVLLHQQLTRNVIVVSAALLSQVRYDVIEGQAHLNTRIQLQPASLHSKLHKRLKMTVAQATKKVDKVRSLCSKCSRCWFQDCWLQCRRHTFWCRQHRLVSAAQAAQDDSGTGSKEGGQGTIIIATSREFFSTAAVQVVHLLCMMAGAQCFDAYMPGSGDQPT
jgi:hypothetical protein